MYSEEKKIKDLILGFKLTTAATVFTKRNQTQA